MFRRLITYLRQTFIEDISLTLLIVGLLLTIFCWTIGIFVWGIDLLLLPITLGIFLLMLLGPVILVVNLIKKNKGSAIKARNLGRLKSFVFGTYLGFALLKPIDHWDEKQRQKSGLLISERLEIYKKENGKYPTNLSQIKSKLTDLPNPYTWDKFTYHLKSDNDYDLDIPVAIMDRWHWEREKHMFIYDDF